MKTEITFINHASFQVKRGSVNILFDPWFFGRVFNETWSLIEEGFKGIKLGITHILISHEHPDHLHFPTLKKLKEDKFLSEDCILVFPFRKEKSIKNAIEKLNIKFLEIPSGKNNSLIIEDIICTYYSEVDERDHSIVIKCPDLTLLNQNDHYTSIPTCKKIIEDYEKVDYLFTQFSLAGYYANKENGEIIINNGTDFHKKRLVDYANIFKPKFVIPFASFVYFCDEYNEYLNNYIVNLQKLSNEKLKYSKFQFVSHGDDILSDELIITNRNIMNLKKLSNIFSISKLKIYESPRVDLITILEQTKNLFAKNNWLNKFSFIFLKKPRRGIFIKNSEINLNISKINENLFEFYGKFQKIYDLVKLVGINKRFMLIKIIDYDGVALIIDTWFYKKIELINDFSDSNIDFSAPSRQLNFALKFPWGVDTMHISATTQTYTGRADALMWLINKNNMRL